MPARQDDVPGAIDIANSLSPGLVVYSPPRHGLPYILVTVAEGGITSFTPVATQFEVRAILARQRTDDRKKKRCGP
jgi:hypothetical protein